MCRKMLLLRAINKVVRDGLRDSTSISFIHSNVVLVNLFVACSLIFPEETPEGQYSKISANAVDIFKHAIKFCLSHRRFAELLVLLERLGLLYKAFDLQSGMCKMMLAVTLVQLHIGDVVQVV